MTEQEAAIAMIKNSHHANDEAHSLVTMLFASWYVDGTFDILCEETEVMSDGSDLFAVIKDLQSIALNEMEVKDVLFIGLV